MPNSVTVAQLIEQLINPVLNLVVAFLRPLGVLAAGIVAGSVLRHTLLNRIHVRFSMPLMFLGVVALFWAAAEGRWSSPAALAALGFGVLIGYGVRRSPVLSDRPPASVDAETESEASVEPVEP